MWYGRSCQGANSSSTANGITPMSPNAGGGNSKPWNKPQPQPDEGQNDGGSTAGNIIDGAAEVAGGALDAVGSVVEGAGSVLEGAGGCLDGCSGCSLAILVTLLATAGTAMAVFR